MHPSLGLLVTTVTKTDEVGYLLYFGMKQSFGRVFRYDHGVIGKVKLSERCGALQ